MEATDILQNNNNFIIHDDINGRHQLTSLGIKSLLSMMFCKERPAFKI